ncbi:uncharacterized protein LOC129769189 [Toxorhynchites rutilus septentrionalis]|uniref:uncharacterized protein LOC129769189 n=1 Tax=Toxorhynchites rutilus septentrionalis TaxID=329112 RepID=UPI00247A5980|nr:uncharacterized protein LOC129769189 [Toxorhynchites rutilus septentrionalis]
MRKCYLLLLLPVVFTAQSPAAVFEDVFELGRPSVTFRSTLENKNGMQAYLRKRNRQRALVPSAISPPRIDSYSAASERYQDFQETLNDRIRLENLKKIATISTKRFDTLPMVQRESKKTHIIPKEVFHFTLSDVMIRHPLPQGYEKQHMSRVKRSENPERREPMAREILWFEHKDAIRREQPNNEERKVDHHRSRRSAEPTDQKAQEKVSFELKDGKVPETTVSSNLRMPFTTSDTFKRGSERRALRRRDVRKERQDIQKNESDLNVEETRRVKINRGNKKKVTNYEDLPLGVQKAIDIAIHENERVNAKSPEEPPKATKYYFGDKKPKVKKPFSAAVNTKLTHPSAKDNMFVPSPQIESGFVPSKQMQGDSNDNLMPEKTTPANWWTPSNLIRPKRLYQKSLYIPPLVVSPQYVNTYKPTMESNKMKELSPGYQHGHETYDSEATKEVIIGDKPKIQYVIKENSHPVRIEPTRTKITLQPTISISYDQEPTAPTAYAEGGHSDYNIPYGPLEVRYQAPKESTKTFQKMNIVVPDQEENNPTQYYSNNNNQVEQSQSQSQSKTQASELSHSSGDGYGSKTRNSIAALSALIGKRPTVQLKGLNDLLHMPVPIGNAQPLQKMKTKVRPQENTAPIVFPMESSTSRPQPKKNNGYRSVKIESVPKANIYDNTSPDVVYNTIQMKPQLRVPMTKDYTPIQESVADISESDFVASTIATPTHATYIVSSTPVVPLLEVNSYENDATGHGYGSYQSTGAPLEIYSTPETIAEPISVQYQSREVSRHNVRQKYEHSDHQLDGNSEHHDESEGYAFGYRVRDFHSGNDFGHVQNRDNGVTRGEYHILLPDGRVQNVRYTADDKGFHADVSYESIHAPHEAEHK